MTIMDLKKWLKQRGNTPAKLAVALGYPTSDAIVAWLSRGNIPKLVQPRLERAIKWKQQK